MGWFVLVCGAFLVGLFLYHYYSAVMVFPRKVRLSVFRDGSEHRAVISFLLSMSLLFVLGLFFLITAGDIAVNWDVTVPQSPPPMSDDLTRAIKDFKPVFGRKELSLEHACMLMMNIADSPVPFSARVGSFDCVKGYWQPERAALEIGGIALPVELTTRPPPEWRDGIPIPPGFEHVEIEPQLNGHIDLSKAPLHQPVPCEVVLDVRYPIYVGREVSPNNRRTLTLPFYIFVVSPQESSLIKQWGEYHQNLRTVETRGAMWALFGVFGILALADAWWFHRSARRLRSRMEASSGKGHVQQ